MMTSKQCYHFAPPLGHNSEKNALKPAQIVLMSSSDTHTHTLTHTHTAAVRVTD